MRYGEPRSVLVFRSSDYVGPANHPAVVDALIDGARRWGVGSGPSRLVSGHSEVHEALEADLAAWLARCILRARAIFFGTGYLANLALLTALGTRRPRCLPTSLIMCR